MAYGRNIQERTRGTKIQSIFGYPPDNLEPRTNEMIKKSFPVVRFFPSEPVFQRGLDLFTIKPVWDMYTELLLDNGYTTPNSKTQGIQCAFLADNFPTDSFTNEYGENFLQKFTDVASEGAASIAQMMGAKSATEAFNKYKATLQDSGAAGTAVGKGMGYVGQLAGGVNTALQAIPAFGKTIGTGVNLVNRLMAGSRIDFPMVWKSSGFQPSYSMTIRLYNPFPQDPKYTKKYIIGPVTALMLLGVPRANDASTYTWPFLHRIECPGIFELNPGFISNITVIKGGDQQQISFQQRLGIVDVRIDIGSLYSSILAGSRRVTANRPTVAQYAKIMEGGKKVESRKADNIKYSTDGYNPSPRGVGKTNIGGEAGTINLSTDERFAKFQKGETLSIDQRYARLTPGFRYRDINAPGGIAGRKISPKSAQKVEDDSSDPTPVDRVSDAAREVYERLKGLGDLF